MRPDGLIPGKAFDQSRRSAMNARDQPESFFGYYGLPNILDI
jgi:hypothetical protein